MLICVNVSFICTAHFKTSKVLIKCRDTHNKHQGSLQKTAYESQGGQECLYSTGQGAQKQSTMFCFHLVHTCYDASQAIK